MDFNRTNTTTDIWKSSGDNEREMRFIESIPISTIGIFLVSVGFQLAALSCSCPAQDIGNLSSGSSPVECPPADGDKIGITVEVTDKSGRPVTGLGESDFKVFDNKQTQKILDFRAVDATHPPAVPLRVEIIIDAVNSDALLVMQERDGLSAFLKQTSDMLASPTTIWFLENTGLTPIAGHPRIARHCSQPLMERPAD